MSHCISLKQHYLTTFTPGNNDTLAQAMLQVTGGVKKRLSETE